MGRRLRAIDLYSGVGGWALGLKMAGVEVVASYELWPEANATNRRNNGHDVPCRDIRKLSLKDLPADIDIVVGSPPCIEFSYANRGGGGDIADGLRDITKFLSIVDHLKPRAWAMENVPRIAEILDRELTSRGKLARFRHLEVSHEILNAADFGLPQRRLRCIAGNLDFKLLKTYAADAEPLTLGAVVQALSEPVVTDPIYGVKIDRALMHDHDPEDFLDEEEERINRSAKLLHTVYNKMAFPDPLDRSVRTITATCTRVSRESIIVEDPASPGRYRRLTLRERSTLQGFPVTFNFYGSSHSHKLRMIGNAMPPLLSFYVGQALRRSPRAKALAPLQAIKAFAAPTDAPKSTPLSRAGTRFPKSRTFRFAVPSLHFRSGVRFELRNKIRRASTVWTVGFVFGSPKCIQEMPLAGEVLDLAIYQLPIQHQTAVRETVVKCRRYVRAADVSRMQDVWSHRGPGLTRPFMLLDHLDECAVELKRVLAEVPFEAAPALREVISATFGRKAMKLVGLGKLEKNALAVFAGLLLGSAANIELEAHGRKRRPATATPRYARRRAGA
jgi:DNA (cytosine-5)-methyltransferase 1